MAEGRAVNPLVEQFRKGSVPRELRMMAAQGLLPLNPVDVTELLHHLLSDSDAAIRDTAGATLGAIPAGEMLALLKDRETPVGVLAWGLSHRTEKELREAALQNPSTPDEAIEAVAPGLPENLAELVVINQVRLLRRTTLLVALEGNPDLSADQRRRLRELRESFHIGEKPVEAPPPPPPPPEAPPEEEAAVEPVEGEGEVLTEEQAIARYLTADERQHEERVSAVQMVYRMNAAQKVIAALKESREVRAILVRDPNRIVSSAVLGSPKLTEPEIESFSGMRGVSTEVLRAIASNKDWTKRYGVIANLVKNPRSPLPIALNLIPRLNPRDLKTISVDRNVPEAIRKHAAKFIRGAPAAGGGGGKR
jgi:hypothetical protein